MTDRSTVIAARSGRAAHAATGATIDVINAHGTQVVDFVSACPQDLTPGNGSARRPTEVRFRPLDRPS